ncbi:MAG: ABC transporter ATP-binding protein [Bacteroidales bacterium]
MGGEDRSRVEEVLRQTGLSDLSARKVDRLSDGERQRVFLARALVQDTPFVVLDEPGAFLDIPTSTT